MSFIETVRRTRDLLREEGRISLQGLKREFDLDDDALDELVEELVDVQQVAALEGRVLSWVAPAPSEARRGDAETPVAATGRRAAAADRAPRDYTPKHLADKILQSKSALEGERKQVTVLFADVKGSTELAEQLDPEDWHALLDRFFQILTDGVHRFEGTVNQYTGDGIMALFGAPIAHEDHAQRACYAALSLRDGLARYAALVKREHGVTLATRMGLNSGEVVVGRIGDDLRMDYTAQGQVVHLAQRMEQLASPGQIYVTEHTAARAAGFFRLRDIGPMQVKGLRRPVHVHELEDIGEFRTRFDVAQARGLSRFVGREREMAVLEAAFARALTGVGQVVGIVAEAGTGKSRLTYEFAERCRSRAVDVFVGSCPPHGRSVPLGLIMSEQRDDFGITERDSDAQARAKVAASLSRLGPTTAQFIPFVTQFLGVAESPAGTDLADPEARHRALLRYFETRARIQQSKGMVVVVLDDMHWADDASVTISFELNRIYQQVPSLVVMNFRPEYRPPEAAWPTYEEIRLKPLTVESTADLLRDLLGPEAADRGLELRIQERAAGNPFFAEEIVRSLAESGALEGRPGAYRLAQPVDGIDVPSSVLGVLAARIDRLGEQAKYVLNVAAVIGKGFPVPLLEAVAGLSSGDLDARLHELAQAEFVYQEAAYPEVEYAFKHPLTHQVAYESQLRQPRQRIHRTVAGLLENRYGERLGEKAALIAQHLEAGAEPLAAAQWQARAARWMSASDLSAARTHWSRAQALLEALPPAADRDACLVDCCWELLWILDRTGASLAECRSLYEEGRDLARRLGDRRSEASLEASYAWINTTHRKWDVTRRHAEAAITLADAENHLPAQLFARFALQRVLIWHGSLAECARLGEDASHLTDEATGMTLELAGFAPYEAVLSFRAFGYAHSGQPVKGSALARRVVELCLRPGLRVNMSGIVADDVWNCWVLGDGELALRRAEEGFRLAERFGAAFYRVHTHLKKGMASALVQRWDEARRFLEQGRALMGETGAGVEYESAYDGFAALCLAALGARQDALDTAQRAVRTAAGDGPYFMSVVAGCLRARVLRMVGGVDHAEELAGQIADTLEAIARAEMESWRPLILLERVGLHQLTGDADATARDLGEASELFRRMGVTGWDTYARSITSGAAWRPPA